MRIIFFGTPAFAVPSLEALAAAGHVIATVVTQPDRPRGRGQRLQPSDVKRSAVALRAPVLQPTRLKDPQFARDLREVNADLGVVAAYGRILPAAVLTIPRLGMINVHASLLPRWRGAAPVHRAILAGDAETGVTIMRVVEALDAGPMLAKVSTPIGRDETSQALEMRLARLGANLLVDVVGALQHGVVEEVPQDETAVTYAARLEKRESDVDWNRPSHIVHDQIRGLQPWPLAAANLHGRRIVFRASEPLDTETHSVQPGTVLRADKAGIVVATSPGAIRLTELQAEGRPAVPAAAFLNGHPVHSGERFDPLPAPPA